MQSELDLTNENLTEENVAEFCRRWRVEELSLDHSTVHHSPSGDPQLHVRFDPSAEWSFAERLRMQREFQLLSGHTIRIRKTHSHRRSLFTRALFNA